MSRDSSKIETPAAELHHDHAKHEQNAGGGTLVTLSFPRRA